MQLYSIRGGNKEDLENKQYNIGVGISLGNKWFTPENIVELVKWSLQYTKENVIVYVADSIHAINLEVRNSISYERALKKTNIDGDNILKQVMGLVNEQLPESDSKKVLYVKWSSFVDESYKAKLNYLYELYKNNEEFKTLIHSVVNSFLSKEERKFKDRQINRFGDYLIEEIPEHINRVNMAGIRCDAYVYPENAKFPELIEKIQKGEIFPEIKKNIMDTEPKVFMEVR